MLRLGSVLLVSVSLRAMALHNGPVGNGVHGPIVTRAQAIGTWIFLMPRGKDTTCVNIPTRFLDIAGCLSVQVNVGGFYYLAILDTGSPFLTAPPECESFTTDASRRYPVTDEQYGQAVGQISWRQSTDAFIGNEACPRAFTLGVVSRQIIEQSGGLFVGLMYDDDNRPTVLKQLGYDSFVLDYGKQCIQLFKNQDIFVSYEKDPMQMFDFSWFGPNLHHYGVLSESITFTMSTSEGKDQEVRVSDAKRPVVVVFDTGLTGCIISDSLEREFDTLRCDLVTGATLELGDHQTIVTSDQKHWFLSSFRLPWFPDDESHPHVVAAGATFLTDSQLLVDARRRRLSIIPRQDT